VRRFLAFIFCMLLSAPATASAAVGAPLTHGPDPAAVGHGAEAGLGRAAKVASLPAEWCGVPRSSDDAANETANGGYKYHAVYMVPSDGADRFAQFAGAIQADALQASALLEAQYGRAIRFDMGTSCGPEYLDITLVRTDRSTAELEAIAQTATGTFDAVSAALDAAGLETIAATDSYARAAQRNRNYVVWLDGPGPAGSCGQAAIYDDPARTGNNLNNFGGKVALVFRNGAGAFCSSNAVRHEIGHNLGALQPGAPHAFDGSHCDDAYEDTMCYSRAPRVGSGQRGQFFDWGNDDYWDPPAGEPLPWWTVNLNRFLCPDATCNVTPGAGVAEPPPPVVDPPLGAPPAAGPEQRRPRPRLRVRAKRRGTLWKLRIRATGAGRGVVSVRCRTRRHGRVRVVYRRATDLPSAFRTSVRCRASRPKARLRVRG
jgi:hypothetical protein